eukprot:6474394-Amphidinium_carterae.1
MEMWLTRLTRLGLEDMIAVRQTHAGCQVRHAQGQALQYGLSVECEQQWSMSSCTVVGFLVSLLVSVRSAGVIGLNTDSSRPLLLLQCLLHQVLQDRTTCLRASPGSLAWSIAAGQVNMVELLESCDRHTRAVLAGLDLGDSCPMPSLLYKLCLHITVKQHRKGAKERLIALLARPLH